MSDNSPVNSVASGSQEPKSTTPIALRTRRCETQVSFYKAAQLKQCKICPSSFSTLQKLRKHVLNHRPNTKRRKALEAIDSLIQEKSTPSSSHSNSKEDTTPVSLFSKFKRVFPELFSDAVEPLERSPAPVSTSIPSQEDCLPPYSSNNIVSQNSPKSVPNFSKISCSLTNQAQYHTDSPKNTDLISSPPPEEITACLNDILNSITHINAKRCTVLPATSSIIELQDDLLLSTSSSSEDSSIHTSTPIQSIPIPQPQLSPNSILYNNLVQEQSSSPIYVQANIIPSTNVENISPSPTCLKPESDISILDLILTNSQESLEGGLVNNLSPPKISINNSFKIDEKPKFYSAAKEGLCLICSKKIILEDLLQHFYRHKPGPLRAKCLEGFRACFPPSKLPFKKLPTSNQPQTITPIEATFREKFPELPIFNSKNSPDNSSSDESVLLEQMDSPPTGPPPISPFKRALYSRVVKKGLFRCQFCEKAFVSEEKAILHKKNIHNISPHKTVAKFFPDCPPEMCRVCCKGPAPYPTIADHYKYVHNLSISTSTSARTTSSIDIPSNYFVSSTNKHSRNFITNSPPSAILNSKPSSPTSKKIPPANISCNTKFYNNLKIVARPELRGAGPSKIVSMPASAICKKSSPPPKIVSLPSSTISKKSPSPPIVPHQVSVQAEVHHRNSSQINQNSSPRKCALCPFIAIKQIGLRLHYFKIHGLRKIPSGSNIPQDSALPTQIQVKQTKSSPHPPSSHVNNVLPVSSKIIIQNTSSSQVKNSRIQAPTLSSPAISTQIFTAKSIPPGTQDSNNPPTPMISSLPIVPFVSMNNSILQYSFPLPTRLQCPIEGCNASFGTKSWFTTNSSIKKHLNVFHNQKPSKVKYHCSVCNTTIAKNPAKHSCLVDNLILPPPAIDGDHWVCHICECFSANTQLAKKNHLEAHKRESIKNNSSRLIIPTASKLKKKLKSSRIKELSEGPPGNLPLAPPLPEVSLCNPPLPEEEEVLCFVRIALCYVRMHFFPIPSVLF
ncbi:hypothetical protein NPIL_255751 [Nephila pilipes]|uniref:C2H2-type domain-containing protein n=1 Tax=Nephila pilipes TaxID=299642 RepID=A0A8X6NX03_NEPPI|nr:hypothetical protein NPIL_255751 [Nephila pilipes]